MANRTTPSALASFIKDAQGRIRIIAAQFPARAAALTDRKNYRTASVRRMVSEGTWATQVDVLFTWPDHLRADSAGDEQVSGRGITAACCDSERDARAVIVGRCASI